MLISEISADIDFPGTNSRHEEWFIRVGAFEQVNLAVPVNICPAKRSAPLGFIRVNDYGLRRETAVCILKMQGVDMLFSGEVSHDHQVIATIAIDVSQAQVDAKEL